MSNPISPDHYQTKGMECIDFIEEMGIDLESFCVGNAIKYIYRYRNKNGAEDLLKAAWYLNYIANRLMEEEVYVENEQT